MLTDLSDLIVKFVDQTGGIDALRERRHHLREIAGPERSVLVRKLVADDEGAQQLGAAAMLGYVIAATVWDLTTALQRPSEQATQQVASGEQNVEAAEPTDPTT